MSLTMSRVLGRSGCVAARDTRYCIVSAAVDAHGPSEGDQLALRILFVNTFHYRRAGAEVHALDLADHLRAHGHEVRFFSMQHPENIDSPDARYWVPEIDFVEMNASKNPANTAKVLGRAIYSPSVRRSLARMLDDWRPDIAHVHNLHAHLTPSVLVELDARGVPIVWTLHDYKLICPNTDLASHGVVCERCKGRRYMQCFWNACKKDSRAASLVASLEAEAHRFVDIPRRVDRFIAPSEFLRDKFIEFGWPGDKLVCLPNFTNLALAAGVEMPEGRRVLYAGRLVEIKGVLTLLEAVRQAPDIRLDIAGEGPLRERIEAMVADPSWRGAEVVLHGLVGPDLLGELIDGARVAVVPSQWYENSPYSVIEAFAHARPVVASKIGGLPELVQDGVSGITVCPGDSVELAAAIRTVLDHDDVWSRLAEGALGVAAQRDPDGFVRSLLALYGDVLERSSGSASLSGRETPDRSET